MKHVMLALSLAAVVATGPGAAAQSRDGNARSRDIYVSVLDGKGAPVPGLGIADFAVREDSVTREVLKVAPATAPLNVIVLIDDSQAAETAIQPLREGLPQFVDKLAGKADIGLVTVGERPTSLVEHTTDVAALKKGITRIFSRPGSGSYLLDAILDTSKGLQKREVERAHIVVITMEAVEFSTLQYQPVLSQLYASGATLHVLSIGQPAGSADDESRNRGMTIAEGTAQTGGRRDQVLAPMGIPEKLRQVADELLNQYVVTYGRPDALIPPTKVQVTGTRAGLTVRARTRLAAR
jgi:VWFA-related protein